MSCWAMMEETRTTYVEWLWGRKVDICLLDDMGRWGMYENGADRDEEDSGYENFYHLYN